MSIVFGSPEANEILAADILTEKIRAESGNRLENIEVELEEIYDEISFCEDELSHLERRKHDLYAERTRLESGKPG